MADVISTTTLNPSQQLQKRLNGFEQIITGKGDLQPGLATPIIKFASFFQGHVALGTNPNSLKFPSFMVETRGWRPRMQTNGRFHVVGQFVSYIYLVGNHADRLHAEATKVVDALTKLFSNNALNDRNTPGQSSKFEVLPGYWYDSDMDFRINAHGWYSRQTQRQEDLIKQIVFTFNFKDYFDT